LECILSHYRLVRITRKEIIENIRKKLILNPIETEILKFIDEWLNFYKEKVPMPRKPEGVTQHIGNRVVHVINDYKEFPLAIGELSPMRFNWAFDQVLCTRKDLWKVVWSAKDRWVKVESKAKKQQIIETINKDPFMTMLDNDILLVFDRVLYLRQCWKEEMRIQGDSAMNKDLAQNEPIFNPNPGKIEVLAGNIQVEILDFLKGDYINKRYWEQIKKEVKIGSLKKFSDWNFEEFIFEYEIDQMALL